jgi:pimeloyl-ACP methyl ester carboxylesterase
MIADYAPVNGLRMYYEIHGESHGRDRPLVLVHGALSGIGTSFGTVLPLLAGNRRIIAVELQGHGHTADVDRPLTVEQLADDVVAVVRYLGIDRADFFGYSWGAAIVLQLAIRHPEVVGRLVMASVAYDSSGVHPGVLDGIEDLQPVHLEGSVFAEAYARVAPNPDDWPALLEKVKRLDLDFPSWPADAVRAIEAPALLVYGDADLVRPEHMVELFRLFGGGVAGDLVGLPKARLAVLPGTNHVDIPLRAEWLASMIDAFLA